jgi:chemotaxis protein methyltransferase WspC
VNPRDLLRQNTGLDLAQNVADRAVASRLAHLGLTEADAGDYLRNIGTEELKALIELVVVPESWMFRDTDAFAAVIRFTCEKLAASPDRIVRILSIPCAGGEEPYSIAMALHDAGVPASSTVIEAIDLSEVALERARQGRYTRNAFRGVELSFRDRHFTQVGNEYQINEGLRRQVRFSQGNLLAIDAGASTGRYDILFCRNLLIYFDEETAAIAIGKLHTLLADDGMLFAGYAEVPAFCSHGFTPLRVPGAFALQKERRGERAKEPEPGPAAAAPPRAQPAVAPPPSPAPRAIPKKTVAAAAPAADPGLLLQQASRLADQGDYAGAKTACNAVRALRPDSADAYFILGLVGECENKPGVADDYWRRCVYLQPDHYEALCHLALLAENRGDAAQAASYKQRAARVYSRRDGDARERVR